MLQPGYMLLLLLLWVLSGFSQENPQSSHKVIGESCRTNKECQSSCCSTSSLSQETFCLPRTFFLKCQLWSKPNGFICNHDSDCHSGCCTTTSNRKFTFCKSKTLFLQCLPWKKPIGTLCTEHGECDSQCCVKARPLNPPRCIQRSGTLALCLPVEQR